MPEQSRSPQAARNIESIVKLEKEALDARTPVDRAIDGIAALAGRPAFLVWHTVGVGLWVVFNATARAVDPFPFTFLTLLLSVEAIYLSVFVLISQNRMSHVSERRAHLDLQINMLAESEMTKVLVLLRDIGVKLDLPEAADDAEIDDLAARTDVNALSQDLNRKLEQAERPRT